MNECRVNAFNQLKELLKDHVMLAAPNDTGNFTTICDASYVGVGAVLMQQQGGKDMPLEFASKSLSLAEENWDTYEREGFVIRGAVDKFSDYIKIKMTLSNDIKY